MSGQDGSNFKWIGSLFTKAMDYVSAAEYLQMKEMLLHSAPLRAVKDNFWEFLYCFKLQADKYFRPAKTKFQVVYDLWDILWIY